MFPPVSVCWLLGLSVIVRLVCWFVGRITQKLLKGFPPNLDGGSPRPRVSGVLISDWA